MIHRWPVNSPHKGQWRGIYLHLITSSWRWPLMAANGTQLKMGKMIPLISTLLMLTWISLRCNVGNICFCILHFSLMSLSFDMLPSFNLNLACFVSGFLCFYFYIRYSFILISSVSSWPFCTVLYSYLNTLQSFTIRVVAFNVIGIPFDYKIFW